MARLLTGGSALLCLICLSILSTNIVLYKYLYGICHRRHYIGHLLSYTYRPCF